MSRRAIVLFNLGGPDSPKAIQPFLNNLFSDPSIINLPTIFRLPLAYFISKRRATIAQEIYAHLGGKSPLLGQTIEQASALEALLMKEYPRDEITVYVCMRYWHPMTSEVIADVILFDPDQILLLPLYPQFSTATTQSSLLDWGKKAKKLCLKTPTYAVCCYPTLEKLADAQADILNKVLDRVSDKEKTRVLFSAHGLPKKIINQGDPYQWQVEQSAQLIAEAAGLSNTKWCICYQSRVGPLKWIEPSLEQELERAAKDGVAVVVLPVAFVSEHSETLVELDIEYKDVAERLGITEYYRVPAVGTHPIFIQGLKEIAVSAFEQQEELSSFKELRCCPSMYNKCPSSL
ncbi:ferrochelatase [Rhodospirillales bacterium]|nr:ferrochelatase [Rhodospirillales bacterium]